MNNNNSPSPFPSKSELVDRAILLATLTDLSTPHFLAPVISCAANHTRERLVIVLFSRHFNIQHSSHASTKKTFLNLTFPEIQGISHTASWDSVQRILTFTYVQATKVAHNLNRVLMDVDVLLKGFNEDLDPALGTDIDICYRVSGDSIAVPLPESISFLRQSYLQSGDRHPESRIMSAPGTPDLSLHSLPPEYPVTALGGTFDHLHAGHKILLSIGAYITSRKLVVGLTDDVLLKSKSNPKALEPFSVRSKKVISFVKFFKPHIEVDVSPLTDVYGPTGWDPDIQALVVSKETIGGADAIAKHRSAHELPPLQPFLVDVISATNASLDHGDAEWLKKHKLSSTYIRQWIVENCVLEDEVKGNEGGGKD